MRKIFSIIALPVIMLIASSGYNGAFSTLDPKGIAPMMMLMNDSVTVSLGDLRGHHVLLSFWSSTDARSRVDCNRYSAWMKANPSTELRHISVNFDHDKDLFYEIVKRDGLDRNAQFNVQGDQASQIVNDYHLDSGSGTLLIGPDGLIVAKNPSESELTAIICH